MVMQYVIWNSTIISSYNNSFGSNWGGGFNFNVNGVAYYIKNNISYKDVPDAAT